MHPRKIQLNGPVYAEAVISNKTRDVAMDGVEYVQYLKVTREEHSWVTHIPKIYFRYPINGGERIEISIEMDPPLKVKKCGIHLAYKPNITEEDRGQSSCLNADNRDELMDDMNLKRGHDVDTSCDLSNEDKFHERMRMEPDQTKNLDKELDQLKNSEELHSRREHYNGILVISINNGITLWAVYAANEDRTERIVAPQAIFSNRTKEVRKVQKSYILTENTTMESTTAEK
ncbi:hypothetical protein F0562_000043 [Nyssa sinensis]|uniref:Uncharacterized protein n=1 Tax=Nyssa sinensis TaxID=561372 RepID=A0A5J5BZI3_9ASTE|nr:hypothetical protein F0562_000043 [Nyssa sinensis]